MHRVIVDLYFSGKEDVDSQEIGDVKFSKNLQQLIHPNGSSLHMNSVNKHENLRLRSCTFFFFCVESDAKRRPDSAFEVMKVWQNDPALQIEALRLLAFLADSNPGGLNIEQINGVRWA